MWKIVGIEGGFPVYTGNRRIDEAEKTQHYTYFASDLLKAKGLGLDMIRYGIPWHKVEPQPGKFDWQWVDGAMDLLLSLEMTPIVDLVHFGTPDWLLPDGGFASKQFPAAQARYVAEFAGRYSKVKYFTITNEPIITARFCGKTGYWHPFRTDAFELIAENLVEGILLSAAALKRIIPGAVVMQNDTCEYHHCAGPGVESDCDRLNEERFCIFDRTIDVCDIVGLDYYPWNEEFHSTEGTRTTPKFGLYGLAKQYYARFKKPMILAETDAAGTIEQRLEWMEHTLLDCQRLNHEGIPMLGYTWWPLIDNINWGSFKDEDSPDNAGLYSMVKNERGNWEREETPLVLRFKQFIEKTASPPLPGPNDGSTVLAPHTSDSLATETHPRETAGEPHAGHETIPTPEPIGAEAPANGVPQPEPAVDFRR